MVAECAAAVVSFHDRVETITEIVSAFFSALSFGAILIGAWQLREAKGQRGVTEALDLREKLERALLPWKSTAARDLADEIDVVVGDIFGLYEVCLGAINRRLLSGYAADLLSRHFRDTVGHFCTYPSSMEALNRLLLGDVCDEIRYHILKNPSRFRSEQAACVTLVFFQSSPGILDPTLSATINRYRARYQIRRPV